MRRRDADLTLRSMIGDFPVNRRCFLVAALGLAGLALPAEAAQTLNPVRRWKGNDYLFTVREHGGRVHLTCFRAVGHRWEQIGTTTLRRGQTSSRGGFVQDIWFGGAKRGAIRADLNNPFWRYRPADDRAGPSWERFD